MLSLAIDQDDPVLAFSARWAQAIAESTESVDVITMRSGALPRTENLNVRSLGLELGYSEPRRAVRFYRSLAAGLRNRGSYDVCFAHQAPLFACLAWPLLAPARVPIVLWYAHGSVSRRLAAAEKAATTIVTSSPEGFRIDSNKVRVIGQGIDVARFTPGDPEETNRFTVAIVGRISRVKRIEMAFDAVRRLIELDHPDVEVRVVGPVADNGYLEELQEDANSGVLRGRVSFIGPVVGDKLTNEYRRADLMLNSSATGSVDKAVLEAMSCGCPVVCSNEPFQAILAPEPGLFVDEAESEALVDACQRIYDMSPSERKELGTRLRRIVVEHHSLEQLIERLIEDVFPASMSHLD